MNGENGEFVAPSAGAPLPGRTAPKVLGILLIVLGSIYLLYSLFGAIFAFIGSAFAAAVSGMGPSAKGFGNANLAAMDSLKTIYVIQGIEKLAAAALSALALSSGIGLVQYRAWGLRLALWWGIGSLLYLLADTLVYVGVIMPIMLGFFDSITKQAIPSAGTGMMFFGIMGRLGVAGTILVNLVFTVMPVLTIVFMTRGSVRRACGLKNASSAQ